VLRAHAHRGDASGPDVRPSLGWRPPPARAMMAAVVSVSRRGRPRRGSASRTPAGRGRASQRPTAHTPRTLRSRGGHPPRAAGAGLPGRAPTTPANRASQRPPKRPIVTVGTHRALVRADPPRTRRSTRRDKTRCCTAGVRTSEHAGDSEPSVFIQEVPPRPNETRRTTSHPRRQA